MSNLEEIYQAIPHRPPFLFVDTICQLTENSITTTKKISIEEPYFKGHYPDNPIMPGVLICEAIFQSGAILISKKINYTSLSKGIPVITRIKEAKFRKMVKPGDILKIEVEIKDIMSKVFFLQGKATISGKTAVSIAFSCTLIEEKEKSMEAA